MNLVSSLLFVFLNHGVQNNYPLEVKVTCSMLNYTVNADYWELDNTDYNTDYNFDLVIDHCETLDMLDNPPKQEN